MSIRRTHSPRSCSPSACAVVASNQVVDLIVVVVVDLDGDGNGNVEVSATVDATAASSGPSDE
jgi:hypothetical protein